VTPFQHEALIYDGPQAFLAGTLPFVRDGLRAGEPVLVAVAEDKIALLQEHLGDDADDVRFVDMVELGANPTRIIPAWRDFAGASDGRPVRGIGEPVWAGRSQRELVECQLHEALLNVAFADREGFRLMCPYDEGKLGPSVVHEARCSHPLVSCEGGSRVSHEFRAHDLLAPFEAPLPPPAGHAEVLSFEDELGDVRSTVARAAARVGLDRARAHDLMLAVNELAANSVQHGLGRGVLRIWREADALVCEVRDRGRIDDPLAGRRRPALKDEGGWGLWVANQVCDLVQLRTGPDGTVVRAFMRLD
jgi:anti-sigma regulatory factor (Ser/Thr protein kinase)